MKFGEKFFQTKLLSRLSHKFCPLLPSSVLFTINYDFQDAPRVENIALKQRKSTSSSNGEPSQIDAEDEMIEESPTHAQKGFRRCPPCTYGKLVDYICRFLFPFCFTLFNVFYWRHYLSNWLQKLQNLFSGRNVKVKVWCHDGGLGGRGDCVDWPAILPFFS